MRKKDDVWVNMRPPGGAHPDGIKDAPYHVQSNRKVVHLIDNQCTGIGDEGMAHRTRRVESQTLTTFLVTAYMHQAAPLAHKIGKTSEFTSPRSPLVRTSSMTGRFANPRQLLRTVPIAPSALITSGESMFRMAAICGAGRWLALRLCCGVLRPPPCSWVHGFVLNTHLRTGSWLTTPGVRTHAAARVDAWQKQYWGMGSMNRIGTRGMQNM